MSDIFVSYAKEDRKRIVPLVRLLENARWKVFWDRNIPTGESWRQFIGAQIKVARCIVVAWSVSSVKSEWVHEEADQGKRKKILIPVLIDKVEPPFGFGTIQTADLTDWDGSASHNGFRRFFDDVSRVLGLSQGAWEESLMKTVNEKETTPLRSESLDLSKTEAQIMLVEKDFYDKKLNPNGKVVFDYASGLTWQQNGSDKPLEYYEAQEYIEALNSQQFAGYNDWRLPTLDEAMSLVEHRKNRDNLYINSEFTGGYYIWTCDKPKSIHWLL